VARRSPLAWCWNTYGAADFARSRWPLPWHQLRPICAACRNHYVRWSVSRSALGRVPCVVQRSHGRIFALSAYADRGKAM